MSRPPTDAGENALPWWLPGAVYALATLVLFREFVVSDAMLFGSDTLGLGYVARAFFADALRQGIFPLWNPRILGGTPFLESLAGGDSLYPTSLLLLFMDAHRALGWKLILHVFGAGLFMYGWARAIGVTAHASLVAGLAYLLAPFMVTLIWPGHDGKIFIAALTPLLFWLAERTLRRRDLSSYALLALGIGLVILTTHFQAAYFLFGALGLYYAFRCGQLWKERRFRAFGSFALFLGSAVVGAGVAAVQLLPAVSYVTEHSRRTLTTTAATPEEAREYSSSWGLHPEEVGGLVVPEFVGSDVGSAAWTSDTYWGRNAFKHNHEYAGLVALVLATVAFMGGRLPGARWFFAGLGVLAVLFGLGQHTPVWGLIYDVVPGVSLFRAPSVAAFVFGFAVITLMALGLERALAAARGSDGEWRRLSWVLWGWTGVLGVLTLAAAAGVLPDLWISLLYDDIQPDRLAALEGTRPFIVRGLVVSTVLVAALLGVLRGLRARRIGTTLAAAAVGLMVAVDVGRVDEPFVQTFDFRSWAAPDANVRFLLDRQAREEPFRILSMVGGNGQDVKPALYGLELAAGHHPNDLGRYRELIGMEGSGLPQRMFTSPNVLPLLNVRYILWPVAQIGPLEAIQGIAHLEGLSRVSEVSVPDGRVVSAVYAFPGLPRARLVGDAVVVPDELAVATLEDPEFDPATRVVLPEAPPLTLDGSRPVGSVTWVRRDPNAMELTVETDRAALLVLADNWFPDWQASVDGSPVPVLRANHIQRAVPVEAGRHTVELWYGTAALRTGLWVSLLSIGIALTVLAASRLLRRRRAEGSSGSSAHASESDSPAHASESDSPAHASEGDSPG